MSSLDSLNYTAELDALAVFAGLNLRIEHDTSAPLPWAVWGSDGIDDEDIIGAGESPSEAIEDARAQIRLWSEAGALPSDARAPLFCVCCLAPTTLDRAFRDRHGDHYCPDCQHDDGVCGREHGRVA